MQHDVRIEILYRAQVGERQPFAGRLEHMKMVIAAVAVGSGRWAVGFHQTKLTARALVDVVADLGVLRSCDVELLLPLRTERTRL